MLYYVGKDAGASGPVPLKENEPIIILPREPCTSHVFTMALPVSFSDIRSPSNQLYTTPSHLNVS